MNDRDDWLDRILPAPEKGDRLIFWLCLLVCVGSLALAITSGV